jgi:tRNA pseudouridine32 synthase/23S rRNA pseudouridine746 synthase
MLTAANAGSGGTYQPPVDDGLEILHADTSLLVVNKPSGLLSVPGRGAGMDDCLASRVQARYPDALIVHRLDMETSGLMVLARDRETHRRLSIAFQNRQVEKRYVAVVDGALAAACGEIDLPLINDWPNRPRQKVDHQIGKPSLTRYRVLAYDAASDSTRVALDPETGRTHQLRVHLMSLGHPILGDVLYASAAAQAKAARLLLHADFLAFEHPASGDRLALNCAPPF